MPEKKKKRRKGGKYTPLVWVLTGALMAFFIAYSGNFKLPGAGIALPKPAATPAQKSASSSGNGFFGWFGGKKSSSSSVPASPAVSPSGQRTVKIYLARYEESQVALVPLEVSIPVSASPLSDALNQLIAYRPKDYLNLVPFNTRVKRVWTQGDTAFIDFSEEFSFNSYGIPGFRIQIYQVVYTAVQFEGIRSVHFYMEGKSLDYLGGDGFPIHNPVYPYSELPHFPVQ